jgi:hypothetical protein
MRFGFWSAYLLVLAGAMTPVTANAETKYSVETSIVEVKGTATLDGPRGSHPAIPGAIIYFGDLIRPTSKGTIVIVKCGKQQHQVRSMRGIGEVCPDSISRDDVTGVPPIEGGPLNSLKDPPGYSPGGPPYRGGVRYKLSEPSGYRAPPGASSLDEGVEMHESDYSPGASPSE